MKMLILWKKTSTTAASKNAHERYQNFSEEEKKQKVKIWSWKIKKSFWWIKKPKKRQYSREQYTNLPEDGKQRLVECRKNYSKMQKIKDEWIFYLQC